MKATSMGNIREQPPNMGHSQSMGPDRMQHPRDMREPPSMSKSIPNLRMDNSFEQREPQPHHPQSHMRPAQSVGALQHQGGHPDYYNQSLDRRNDPRNNDYENQQGLNPRLQRSQPDLQRGDRGYSDNQSMPPGAVPYGKHGLSHGGPPSSRNSQSSFREDRPQSAFFGHQQDRQEGQDERPRSMEINSDKIREWQQKYSPMDGPPQHSPNDGSFGNRDPNYMNTRSPPSSHANGYVNQSDIPKMSANNENRQPNFYENTSPRQGQVQPAFHQLRKPVMEPPATAPKPSVAAKPGQKITPAEIPRMEVDNRQTQPHFFDPRSQQQHQQGHSPKPVPSMSQSSYMSGQPHMVHSHDPRANSSGRNAKLSPGREIYNPHHHQSPELPPPPVEIPPELPPPPVGMDMEDDLPPLPPPPAQDYRPDHRDDQDPPYANQGDPRFSIPQGYQPSYNHSPPHQQSHMHQPHLQDPRHQQMGQDHRLLGYAEPQRHPPPQQQPPAKPQHMQPQPYQPNHDYQNINYDGRSPNRSFESHKQNSPNMYETYDHNKSNTLPGSSQPPSFMGANQRSVTLPPNSAPPQGQYNVQLNKNRLVAEVAEVTKKEGKPLSSPWDREKQDELEKMQMNDLKKVRENEIADLESRSYLSPQESERLRKLRLEHEFQRRVEEVEGQGEDEENSDLDISTNSQSGREFLIKSVQEDILKAQKRLEDYNRKRMYEDHEKEKERMEALQQKLEIYQREKEERLERIRKRQERKQREQEESLNRQKELREKQRRDYEEQKRVMIAEEEKFRQRKQEELERRKEMERQQKQKLIEQREAEEKAARAEARRREEEFQRQELERRERERREQQREIRVNEERERLNVMMQQQGYQPYANLPSQQYSQDNGPPVPPPPQRGSSYEVANRSNSGVPNNYNSNMDNFRGMNSSFPARNQPEPSKKSVKFNTQLETHNTYSVGSEDDRTPHQSHSSYRSSQSSDPGSPMGPGGDNQVFDTPQQNHTTSPDRYRISGNTPTVIGAQEVYRDPRARIAAKKDAQGGLNKKAQDRMSFRDKMKFFAQEAGEDTPKYKPKASKALLSIESQLHNGQ